MKWEYEDIIESLQNDYVLHYKNRQHYLENDNEVDANWEGAVCDYIFDKLKEITGGSPTDVADKLQDKLDGAFEFDPQGDPKLYPIQPGTKVCVLRDINYCDYEDLVCIYGEETAKELLEEYLHLDEDGYVYIPQGTHMVYKGSPSEYDGWPVFEIHGEEFDFAGNPLKLKVVK